MVLYTAPVNVRILSVRDGAVSQSQVSVLYCVLFWLLGLVCGWFYGWQHIDEESASETYVANSPLLN